MMSDKKYYKYISLVLIVLLLAINIFQFVYNRQSSPQAGIKEIGKNEKKSADSVENAINILRAQAEVDELLLNILIQKETYPEDSLKSLLNNEMFSGMQEYVSHRLNIERFIKKGQKHSEKGSSRKEFEAIEKKYNERLSHISQENSLLTNQVKYFADSMDRYADSLKSAQQAINSYHAMHETSLSVIEFKRNGYTINYTGEKQSDMANGYGVGIWSTGGIYKGDWKDNLRFGKGTYTWKDGEIYDGQWSDDMRTGEGKYIWKDGQYYIGGWLNNKRDGYGIVYYPNGKVQYQGQWKNDKFIQPKKSKQ